MLIGLLIGMALYLSVDSAQAEAFTPPSATKPIPVAVNLLQAGAISVHFDYSGVIQASASIEIHSTLTGIIKTWHVSAAQNVARGQILVELDAEPFAVALKAAELALAEARATLEQARAEQQLLQARASAHQAGPQISERLVITPETALPSEQQALLALATATVNRAEANLATKHFAHEQAQRQREQTIIRAPENGFVQRTHKPLGALVQAGQDSLLITLATMEPLDIHFKMPEQDYALIRQGLASGQLHLSEQGFALHIGDVGTTTRTQKLYTQLKFQDETATEVPVQNGHIALKAQLASVDSNTFQIGKTVPIRLSATRPQAIVIPQQAIVATTTLPKAYLQPDAAWAKTGVFVYVVGFNAQQQMIAEPRAVVLGRQIMTDSSAERQWVVEQGLNVGDLLIVDGLTQGLSPHTTIVPIPIR